MLDCQATPTTNNNNNNINNNNNNRKVAEEEEEGITGNSNSSSGEEENIHCKYCQESVDGLGASTQPVYWGIQLDQDLLETLVAIYPDWFKGYDLNQSTSPAPSVAMADSGNQQVFLPQSPPKAEVDDTPIQKTMDRHKESLKVKLLLRRPINQLVDQGIMPPLKTPPAFHEQRQKLERAKMGDILKSKIQRRPDRQELIQQHILEDTNVDPSLQDKQRQLKKARLADDLNERLSHRPGPLELIKGNILKADEEFSRALKDGQIPFKRTCEGETRKHPPPPFVFEEDSSSEGAMSPVQESDQSRARSPPDVNGYAALPSPGHCSAVSSLSPQGSSVASPASTVTQSPVTFAAPAAILASPTSSLNPSLVSPTSKVVTFTGKGETCGGKEQNRSSRKKSKSKSTPKTRTIKFHEYKGPPSAQKALLANASQVETSYELLLQQQQLFLQWQLELQHKYPQIILPAAQKTTNSESNSSNGVGSPGQAGSNGSGASQMTLASQSPQQEAPSIRCMSKLEDMKVSDLKAELKKRNLPVSGSKPQLIERLRQHSDASQSSNAYNVQAINGASEASSGPSSLTFDTASSQGSPAEDPSVGMTLEGSVASPGDLALDQGSPETAGADNAASDDVAYGGGVSCNSPSPFSVPAVPAPHHPPLQRPSSVAPMEVDNNSNSSFDPMDVSDIGRNLPQVSVASFPLLSTSPATLISVVHDAGFVSNSLAAPNEEILKKKIEELQRELQRSQFQLQQQQTISQHQRHHKMPQAQQASLCATQESPPSAAVQSSDTNLDLKSPPSADGNSKVQQKLMLQHRLQQKQLQQQGLSGNNGANASLNVKASLAAFLQAQAVPNNAAPQPNKAYFNGNANGPMAAVAYDASNLGVANKQRANSLPNGLGHVRTNSLPNFVGLDTIPQKQQIVRTTTDPQFIFAKPPPDYDEATKQLSKHQFAQTLIETLTAPSGGRKNVKSQAVDDVLEILIKNGELPPSAAQEPPTPPTPKTLQTAILFPSATTNDASGVVTSPSSPGAANLGGRMPGEGPTQQHHGMARQHRHHGGSSSPVPAAPSFDLDLSLDLEGLEPMNLEGFTLDGHIKEEAADDGDDAFLGSSSMDEQDAARTDHANMNDFVDFEDDVNHMDIDMVEVSDWLDAVLPTNGSGGVGTSLTILPSNNNYNNNGNVDCNDPLLSANQGIFNLLNLEDDFRVNHDLVWDKLDFAT